MKPLTFKTFAEDWRDVYPDAKGLKRSTRDGYRAIIDLHLVPALGHLKLDAVTVSHVENHVAAKRRKALAPRSVNRHLNLLHLIYVAATRRGLTRSNPISGVDRPREPRRRWTILSPAEIGRIERTFRELAGEDEKERAWRQQARIVFLTVVGAGLRRGEILGLRWRDVELADPAGARLEVRSAAARHSMARTSVCSVIHKPGARSTTSATPTRSSSRWPRRTSRRGCDRSTTGGTRRSRTTRLQVTRLWQIMKRAGHSDFKTTQGYIDLAGETFRAEDDRLDERLFGRTGTKNRHQTRMASSVAETEGTD